MTTETIELPASVLVKHQTKTYGPKLYTENGQQYRITATVRYDDQCGNGHNSFSITGEIHRKEGNRWTDDMAGCIHDEVKLHFPDLAPFIKWHLTSSDGPMHYVANTVYHADEHGPDHAWVYFDDPQNGIVKQCMRYCTVAEANEMCSMPSRTFNYVSKAGYRFETDPKTAKIRNLKFARSASVWPEATDEELTAPGLEARLLARLPALMAGFKTDMEKLGFTY